MRETFYHGSTKKIIVAFATIFDEIHFVDGYGRQTFVPLHYSPRPKYMEQIQNAPDMDQMGFDTVLPRMGFELTGINFAPERHTNPMNQIDDVLNDDDSSIYMFNRVPYDFTFDLFIGTVRFEDGLKIVEQIVPFFTPELTLTIRDKEEFQMENNISIVLNSVGHNIEYEGSNDNRRVIVWTLNFTAKGWLYSNIRASGRIKKTILELHSSDFDRVYERLTSEVVPREANFSDPHEIIDKTEVISRD